MYLNMLGIKKNSSFLINMCSEFLKFDSNTKNHFDPMIFPSNMAEVQYLNQLKL